MTKWFLASIALAVSISISAEEGFDDDGFDDEDIEIIVENTQPNKGALYGSVDLETHYNFNNDKDLSSFKTLVDILGEYKFDNGIKFSGNLKGYHDFIYELENRVVPDGYENEINLNELNIEVEISPNLDFKLGRQIVVWGKSDSIRITDILNPLDNRTPGLVDIKNLRLGRAMSKLDYYFDNLNLSVIALHENRFTKNAMQYSDFKPTEVNMPTRKPDDSLDNTGVALSLTGAFSGYDLGLYFADIYVDKPYLVESNTILNYDNKSKMLGAAYNQVIGSYLLKAEIAHFNHIKYNGVSDAKARTDALFGFEYNGITDGSIAYEIAMRNIRDYSTAINIKSNGHKLQKEYQQVVRFNQSYLNQTMDLSAVLSVFGARGQDGGSARISLDYALDDQTSVSGGIIDYIGGDNLTINTYKNNDRFFAIMSYLF